MQYIMQCGYCGRDYAAHRSDSMYCCDKCRNYANRYKKSGFPIRSKSSGVVDLGLPRAITQKRVDLAFTNLRGNAAELEAAAEYGPKETRDACRVVCNDVRASLKKVGM